MVSVLPSSFMSTARSSSSEVTQTSTVKIELIAHATVNFLILLR